MTKILKEIKIFLFLFVILALSMHYSAWVTHPIEHIHALASSPLGFWHPLWITALLYLLMLLIRLIINLIKKIKA